MAATSITTRSGGRTTRTSVLVGDSTATTVVVRSPAGDEEGVPPLPQATMASSTRREPKNERSGFRVQYEVKQSSIAGLGVFAAEPIARGTLVWKYDAEFVKAHRDAASLRASLDSLPSDAERVELLEHEYGWDGEIHEILDDGKYWKHSTLEQGQNTGHHPDGSPPGDGVSSYALCECS